MIMGLAVTETKLLKAVMKRCIYICKPEIDLSTYKQKKVSEDLLFTILHVCRAQDIHMITLSVYTPSNRTVLVLDALLTGDHFEVITNSCILLYESHE
jgi:hypothetical protein